MHLISAAMEISVEVFAPMEVIVLPDLLYLHSALSAFIALTLVFLLPLEIAAVDLSAQLAVRLRRRFLRALVPPVITALLALCLCTKIYAQLNTTAQPHRLHQLFVLPGNIRHRKAKAHVCHASLVLPATPTCLLYFLLVFQDTTAPVVALLQLKLHARPLRSIHLTKARP